MQGGLLPALAWAKASKMPPRLAQTYGRLHSGLATASVISVGLRLLPLDQTLVTLVS